MMESELNFSNQHTPNALTALTDADDAHYGAALTCDANGNITTVMEVSYSTGTPPIPESTLQTDFSYDDLNRLTEHKTTRYLGGGTGNTQYVRRDHVIDALGRLVKSGYMTWYEGDTPPTPSTLEHMYDGARHVQNYDGTSAYGAVWHWAGASGGAGASSGVLAPLRSPNPDTASQTGYNISAGGGKGTPQRRTWLDALTEGDKREIYGQGRAQAKDSSGSGANWYLGTVSDSSTGGSSVESRFFFEGTVTATDMSRATDVREAGRIGIFGNSNSYGASYGRVTNEAIGRDLNPLGRGGGFALMAGRMNLGQIMPELPYSILGGGGQGNSVNNGGGLGMGGGGGMPYKGCCCEVEFSRCNGLWWELFDSPNPWCEMWMDSPLAPCNPERHYLLCRCIANGCAPDGPGCLGSPAHQQAKFYSCGCDKFGSMTPFEGSCCGCRPGKFFPKVGGGGGGSGPRAMYSGGGGCCGRGGGGPRVQWNPASTYPGVIAPSCELRFPGGVLKGAAEIACDTLLGCECLPEAVKECVKNACSRAIRIACTFTDPKNPRLPCTGLAGLMVRPGRGCSPYNSPLSMYLCMLEWTQGSGSAAGSRRLARAIIHELLHLCDCNASKHKGTQMCAADLPGGMVGNSFDEGFAQACENACFGEDTNSYTFPWKPSGTSWCCMCKDCYA